VDESRSQAHSRTAGGHPRLQPSHNNDNARGSQAPGGRQQPPPRGNPRQANHRSPPEDLRQHINEGRDARSVIDSRRKVREEVETEGTDYSDRFPAFSARFSSYKYPEGFKPIGSPSTTASKLLSSGYVATPRPLKSQVARTSLRSSTFRWPWTLRRSHGWRASATTRSTPGNGSRRFSSKTSRER
jgi:hypothetical protein